MKDSFVLYGGQFDAIKDFTLEQKGRLLDALFQYVNTGRQTPTITDKEVRIAFSFFRLQIDTDSQKYEEKCEKNKRIAQEREERRKNERTRTYTNVNERTRTSPNNNDKIMNNDNDNDNDNDFFVFLETQKEKNEKNLKWIIETWNWCIEHFSSDLKKVKLLTDERRALLTELLPLGSDKVKQGIINATRSAYLNGRTKERKRPADFDWIVRYDNFVKCVEGSL